MKGTLVHKEVTKAPRAIYFPVIFQYRTEEDLYKKEEKKTKLLKETIPFYLNKFEQTVAENGGYAVGSTVIVQSCQDQSYITRKFNVLITRKSEQNKGSSIENIVCIFF